MASIRKETVIERPPSEVWDAFRDVGAVHTRQARGFVVDCRLEGDTRVVTFANGFVAREVIVDVDEARRRLAYSVRTEQLAHHHASFEVLAESAGRSRVIWIADLLPNAMAPAIEGMMEQGAVAMKKTLESE